MMQTILVVEDDYELNQSISYMLREEEYEVRSAHSIKEARLACYEQEPALIILDVNLPDGEGFRFCKWVKEQKDLPIIFLTARDLEEDALTGYELGAEDYVTKPFSMKILLQKIRVLLKLAAEEAEDVLDDGYLKIDLSRVKVEAGGRECAVTPTEFKILQEFLTHRGQLLTYNVLLERLWDIDGQFVDKHTLAVNINRLRSKIEDEEHKYISNVYGMRYQWIDIS